MTILDAARDQSFLRQRRRDPVTKKLFEPGDRVVICAGDNCGTAFLEASWRAVGERHGRHTGTLHDIKVGAGGAPAPRGTAAGGAEADGAGVGPEPLGLREIKFQLRGIPFSLRRVAGY